MGGLHQHQSIARVRGNLPGLFIQTLGLLKSVWYYYVKIRMARW
jgi:hypothetical protein